MLHEKGDSEYCKIWSERELEIFYQYVSDNQEFLRENLEHKMRLGRDGARKNGFFKNLSKIIGTKSPI